MTRKRLLPRMLKYYKELKAMVETTVFRGRCFCLQVCVFSCLSVHCCVFTGFYLVFVRLFFNVLLPPVLTYFLANHFSFWIESFCFCLFKCDMFKDMCTHCFWGVILCFSWNFFVSLWQKCLFSGPTNSPHSFRKHQPKTTRLLAKSLMIFWTQQNWISGWSPRSRDGSDRING